jgi:hypothetical protein
MKNDFSGKIDGFRELTEEELIETNGGVGPARQQEQSAEWGAPEPEPPEPPNTSTTGGGGNHKIVPAKSGT